MGKAARRRKDRRQDYLVSLSYKDAEGFDSAWELRMESWESEIRYRARQWTDGGVESHLSVFGVLDEAMAVLEKCALPIRIKYASSCYDRLCHECCIRVSGVIDRCLYRLNNMNNLVYNAKKTGRMPSK